MSENRTGAETPSGGANRRIAIVCTTLVLSMVGVSYAAVPLYRLFCQVTGYGGTTQRAERGSGTVLDRTIKVRFDANVAAGLPWDFKPVQREVELKIGETIQIAYTAYNRSDTVTSGQATFNVTPMAAGKYFNKVQCFCFTENQLQPGETLELPVVLFVDPKIVDQVDTKDIETITLSYTFFPQQAEKPVAAAAKPVQDESTL